VTAYTKEAGPKAITGSKISFTSPKKKSKISQQTMNRIFFFGQVS